jgi:ABC-type amino acid transport substrate-binding protein
VTLAELPRHRVATLEDSTAHAFIEQLSRGPAGDARIEPISLGAPPPGTCVPAGAADPAAGCLLTGSWTEAIELLAAGRADLVLGDWAQLTYLARQPELAGTVSVQAATFRLEPYGWGVSPHRPEIRAAIDRALMARVRSTEWRFMVQEYMGTGSISPE